MQQVIRFVNELVKVQTHLPAEEYWESPQDAPEAK